MCFYYCNSLVFVTIVKYLKVTRVTNIDSKLCWHLKVVKQEVKEKKNSQQTRKMKENRKKMSAEDVSKKTKKKFLLY